MCCSAGAAVLSSWSGSEGCCGGREVRLRSEIKKGEGRERSVVVVKHEGNKCEGDEGVADGCGA